MSSTPLLDPHEAQYGAVRATGTSGSTAAGSTAAGAAAAPRRRTKLGTFAGVFLPTSLNVLSILMFLRFGFILGQMGIAGTMLLLVMSYTIDVLTTLSISAISTNGTVKGGGAYYMISRSLGPEFGGSIGIIFFVGQILNASLNVVGLVEPLMVNFGPDGELYPVLPAGFWWQFGYSTALLAVCTAVALVGASLVSRAAFWLFVVLTTSTLSIPVSALWRQPFTLAPPLNHLRYTGPSWSTLAGNMWPSFTSGAAGSVQPRGVPESFRSLFGIFFPATAGIFAGASMSGELKDPSRSIPRGTLRGLLVTFVLYTSVIVAMGVSVPRAVLRADIKVVQTVSLNGVVIVMGEASTALFSVIMGVVGAASMLNAIAEDRIIPGLGWFARSCVSGAASDTKGERGPWPAPKAKARVSAGAAQRRAIVFTWAIAQAFLLSDINQIATFITMAFLMTFIVTNAACFLLRLGSAPNFRPSFRYFSSKTALAGAVTSILAMYIVDGLSASLVIVCLFCLVIVIHYSTPPSKFGDISQLLIYHQVRKYLLRLKLQMSVKYWRPQILLLCDDPRSCWELIGFCNHLKKGGLYILGHVVIMSDTSAGGSAGIDTACASDCETEMKQADHSDAGTAETAAQPPTFSPSTFKELQTQNDAWVKLRDLSRIKAFVQLALGPTLPWGVRNVYLGSGLGGMRPNITVLGFYDFAKHGVSMPLAAKPPAHLPTDALRKERKVSVSQWVQIIEDLIIMQATVAVAANFGSLDLPTAQRPSFWRRHRPAEEPVRYIDLYPIQMSSVDTLADGQSVLSTNFDTYTLILQLGAILTTVGEWKYSHHKLRVIVFVETTEEIDDERVRLCRLLATLRIEAETRVVCLGDGSLASYNFLVKGYAHTATNDEHYQRVDGVLRRDQWWQNLCHARAALRELERARARRQRSRRFAPLNLNGAIGNTVGPMGFTAQRRNTISNLHDQGIALSLNMRSQGGGFFDAAESSGSDTEDEWVKTPQAKINDEEVPDDDNVPSIRFVSEDKDGDGSEDREEDRAASHRQSSGAATPRRGRTLELRDQARPVAARSPSLFSSHGDELLQRLRAAKAEGHTSIAGGADIVGTAASGAAAAGASSAGVSNTASTATPTGTAGGSADDDETISHKQLQDELQQLTFNDLPAKGQHLILNELIRKYSPADHTSVVFSTLPAPPIGTHLNHSEALEYISNLSIWLDGLPPTLLVNSQTITVTTNL
ncbi:Amino acid permease/ SLC12A domain-containing protein [[Candida] zeylanoides]